MKGTNMETRKRPYESGSDTDLSSTTENNPNASLDITSLSVEEQIRAFNFVKAKIVEECANAALKGSVFRPDLEKESAGLHFDLEKAWESVSHDMGYTVGILSAIAKKELRQKDDETKAEDDPPVHTLGEEKNEEVPLVLVDEDGDYADEEENQDEQDLQDAPEQAFPMKFTVPLLFSLSILMKLRQRYANQFQWMVTCYLFGHSVVKSFVQLGARLFINLRYNSAWKSFEKLIKQIPRKIKHIKRGSTSRKNTWGFIFDNINLEKNTSNRVDPKTRQYNWTLPLLIRHPSEIIEAAPIDSDTGEPLKEKPVKNRPLPTEMKRDLLPSMHDYTALFRYNKREVLIFIAKYKADSISATTKKELKEWIVLDAEECKRDIDNEGFPEHLAESKQPKDYKSEICPLPLLELNEASTREMIEIIKELFKVADLTEDDEHQYDASVFMWGDQLTLATGSSRCPYSTRMGAPPRTMATSPTTATAPPPGATG